MNAMRFQIFGELQNKQEIQRLQKVIAKVRFILTQLQQAIKGEVVMTEELQETLYAVYDAKVGPGLPTDLRTLFQCEIRHTFGVKGGAAQYDA